MFYAVSQYISDCKIPSPMLMRGFTSAALFLPIRTV